MPRSRTDPLSVLLIEDNPGDARLVQAHLREGEQAVDLRWEASLEAGLTALQEERPDVVAADLHLPDSEGADTVRRCANAAPSVPVVVLTGEATLDVALSAQKAGAEEYLRKEELSPGLLARTLRWAVARSQMEAKLRRLSEAVEQTQEAVVITEAAPLDTPGPRIVFTNAAHEAMTGYTEGELLGRTPRVFQGPKTERDVLDSLRAALEAGTEWEGETINYRKDGTPFRIQWNVAPVRGPEGTLQYWVSVQRDVTKQRKQEAALRRQRNLLKQSRRLAGAWEANTETGAVMWSEKVYDIFEVSPDADMTVERAMGFYPPEARETLRDAFQQCTTSGASYDLELPITTATGTDRWVRTVGAPIEWEGTRVVKVAGAVQDITDQKRTEEALRERSVRLQGLANTLPGVVFQFYAHPDGTYGLHFVSEYAEELLGISSDPDGFYERLTDHIPPSHEGAFRASVDEAVAQEAPWRFEMPFRRPSGETIWLLGLSTPERMDGELVFNGVLLDISSRKAADQALQNERDRFVTLFGNLPTPVVRGTIGDGKKTITVTDVNTAFEDVFGYSADEIQGEELFAFILPSDQETAVEINEDMMAQGALQMEVQRRTAEGIHDFQLQAAARTQANGPTEVYAMYTDITEQKRRERELTEAKEEAETAAQLKSAMLANMSHEIRTPLTSILGFAEVLADEGVGENVERFARLIAQSGRRLQKTLNSVLELSKLEAGVYELERAPVDLARIADETADVLRAQAEEKGIDLRLRMSDASVQGRWNEGALTRIAENLLENAIKFTPDGGRVEVRVQGTPEAAALEVEDTGIGMEPRQVDRLFQPFKQESEGLEREYEGTGLGLSIVKRLTEAHGGTVDVDTEKGTGTCFIVRLPRDARAGTS
ncbi:MAG: PAS domain S-box protein [Salinibacter sp.]